MRGLWVFIILFLCACDHERVVQLSGRFDSVDSMITFHVGEQYYNFKLDNNHGFEGKLSLEKSTYAFIYPLGLIVFLSPGEDLEIDLNTSATSSVVYKGSLGAINNYLRDQLKQQWIGSDLYKEDEAHFVHGVQEILNRQILLLEAKNLGDDFTTYERERIRYCYAKQVLYYPQIHYRDTVKYVPGVIFDDFVRSFPIDRNELLVFADFRQFALDYIYYRCKDLNIRSIISYILRNVNSEDVREYLVAEVVYRHFCERGLEDVDYLLPICRQVVKDSIKAERINGVVNQWRHLSAGVTAPDVKLLRNEQFSCLNDFQGANIYVCVWSLWNNPWEGEKKDKWNDVVEEYGSKNIRFLTFYIGGNDQEKLRSVIAGVKGEHFIVQDINKFRIAYMIHALPRYFLIDSLGRIVTVNASAPCDSVNLLFKHAGF